MTKLTKEIDAKDTKLYPKAPVYKELAKGTVLISNAKYLGSKEFKGMFKKPSVIHTFKEGKVEKSLYGTSSLNKQLAKVVIGGEVEVIVFKGRGKPKKNSDGEVFSEFEFQVVAEQKPTDLQDLDV